MLLCGLDNVYLLQSCMHHLGMLESLAVSLMIGTRTSVTLMRS